MQLSVSKLCYCSVDSIQESSCICSAACWAHVHCYFEDAWSHNPIPAEFPMGVIKSLFDIERVAAGLSGEERKDLRQRLSKPKLSLLKEWLEDTKHIVLPKSKLGEAIAYTPKRWPALLVYLEYPFVEISNNASERSIKPLVLSRKNWRFGFSSIHAISFARRT